MNREPERGVAYDFWVRVQTEQARRGWNDSELHARSGIPRTTVDRLKKGKRAPQPNTVNSLAKALGIDLDEAHQLSGLVPRPPTEPDPGQPRVSVREAIMTEPAYSDDDRETLLRLLDIIERGKGR